MKKKLSMTLAIMLVITSFIGCQKTDNYVAPATQQVEVNEIEETEETEEIEETDTLEIDEESENSDEDENEENSSVAEGAFADDDNDGIEENDTDNEENDTDNEDGDIEESEEMQPILDEELSEEGSSWNQPEDLVNYKMTVNNLSEEDITFMIYYGVETDFEHEITVSSMASKTIRVENALAGQHSVIFATEAEELLGDVQIWISDETF